TQGGLNEVRPHTHQVRKTRLDKKWEVPFGSVVVSQRLEPEEGTSHADDRTDGGGVARFVDEGSGADWTNMRIDSTTTTVHRQVAAADVCVGVFATTKPHLGTVGTHGASTGRTRFSASRRATDHTGASGQPAGAVASGGELRDLLRSTGHSGAAEIYTPV